MTVHAPLSQRAHALREQHHAPMNQRSVSSVADCPDKRLATLQAALALKGWTLRRDQAGILWVARWDGSASFNTISAAETFARQIGAPL